MLDKLAKLATFHILRREKNGKSAPMSGFYASLSLGYVAKLANLSTWPTCLMWPTCFRAAQPGDRIFMVANSPPEQIAGAWISRFPAGQLLRRSLSYI